MIQESLDEEIWGSQTEREVISNNMGITAEPEETPRNLSSVVVFVCCRLNKEEAPGMQSKLCRPSLLFADLCEAQ